MATPRAHRPRWSPTRWVLTGLTILGFGIAFVAALASPGGDFAQWHEVIYGVGLGMAVASAIGWATEMGHQRLSPPPPPAKLSDAEKALYYFARSHEPDRS